MTLVIKKVNEELIREFKAEAIRGGLTFSEALEQAISLWLPHVKLSGTIRSEEEENNRVYESIKKELERKYKGKYAVICHGRLSGIYESVKDITKALNSVSPKPKHAIVVKIGEKPGVGEWLGGSLEL